MSIGKGTKAGAELAGIISEVESVRDRKKQISDQEKEIFAAAKVKGYDPKTIKRILKVRGEDNKKWQEAQALFDSYMHAIGMAEDLPLFRTVEKMGVDVTVAEQVVEVLSLLVPTAGEIVVKVGAARLRLYRDKEGEPHCEDAVDSMPLDPRYPDKSPSPESTFPPSPKARGLSKEAISAAVERAEATAREKRTMESLRKEAASMEGAAPA
jgi:uncharacterized protein (UPF0335 family)